MKKNILTIGFCLATTFAFAQNHTDGLRYSMEELSGTARFKGMSGAFSSLGGDFSSISQNPAGSSIFTRTELSFSAGTAFTDNKATLLGGTANGKNSISSNDVYFSQFGIVFPIFIGDEGWRNMTFAFNYQQTNNFNPNDWGYTYTPDKNMGDYFVNRANGITQQNLFLNNYYKSGGQWVREFQGLNNIYSRMGRAPQPEKYRDALLGYTAGLIGPKTAPDGIPPTATDSEANAALNEKEYKKNISDGATTMRTINQYSEGGVNKYNFNFGARYDFFSFGINLNSHRVDYRVVSEQRDEYLNNTANIRSAVFQNDLKTTGSGFSLQLGAIAEVYEGVRIGLSYASPTWYTLQDETSQALWTNTSDNRTYPATPNVTNIYEKYQFRTPGAWTVGLSWVWNKQLIVSGDYTYKGYGNMRFTSDDLRSENTVIQDLLGDTSSLRFGAEYRLPVGKTTHLFFRAGTRYEQSPYKRSYFKNLGQDRPMDDLYGFSGGLGLSFSGLRFDLSYDRATRTHQQGLYYATNSDRVEVDNTLDNLLLTVSFKLF